MWAGFRLTCILGIRYSFTNTLMSIFSTVSLELGVGSGQMRADGRGPPWPDRKQGQGSGCTCLDGWAAAAVGAPRARAATQRKALAKTWWIRTWLLGEDRGWVPGQDSGSCTWSPGYKGPGGRKSLECSLQSLELARWEGMVSKRLCLPLNGDQTLFCKQKKDIIRFASCKGHSGYRTEGREPAWSPRGCGGQSQVRAERMAGQMWFYTLHSVLVSFMTFLLILEWYMIISKNRKYQLARRSWRTATAAVAPRNDCSQPVARECVHTRHPAPPCKYPTWWFKLGLIPSTKSILLDIFVWTFCNDRSEEE